MLEIINTILFLQDDRGLEDNRTPSFSPHFPMFRPATATASAAFCHFDMLLLAESNEIEPLGGEDFRFPLTKKQ